jgi:hypothetical protein
VDFCLTGWFSSVCWVYAGRNDARCGTNPRRIPDVREWLYTTNCRRLTVTTRNFFAACALCAALAANLANAGHVSGRRELEGATVDANSSVRYATTFLGGEMAEVVIMGDGDTDLDLFVYDENGNLVASDTDETDFGVCRWTPNWTGEFTVVVTNLGSVYNEFDIATNLV